MRWHSTANTLHWSSCVISSLKAHIFINSPALAHMIELVLLFSILSTIMRTHATFGLFANNSHSLSIFINSFLFLIVHWHRTAITFTINVFQIIRNYLIGIRKSIGLCETKWVGGREWKKLRRNWARLTETSKPFYFKVKFIVFYICLDCFKFMIILEWLLCVIVFSAASFPSPDYSKWMGKLKLKCTVSAIEVFGGFHTIALLTKQSITFIPKKTSRWLETNGSVCAMENPSMSSKSNRQMNEKKATEFKV